MSKKRKSLKPTPAPKPNTPQEELEYQWMAWKEEYKFCIEKIKYAMAGANREMASIVSSLDRHGPSRKHEAMTGTMQPSINIYLGELQGLYYTKVVLLRMATAMHITLEEKADETKEKETGGEGIRT